jgi:hypothetical protein
MTRYSGTDEKFGITAKPVEPFIATDEETDELIREFAGADVMRVVQPAPSADVRSRDTGSNYTASGSQTAPPDVFAESGSSRYQKLPDRVPQFVSRQQAARIYDQMVVNDATVDVSLRVAKTPVLGAFFYMQPFDDDPDNLDINEFCDANVFSGTSQPFLLILEDVLRFFDYGFSMLEPVWELREWAPSRKLANRRKYTMLAKLGGRMAPTISDIKYDDHGEVVSVIQNAIRADNTTEQVTIPIEKLIPFTFNKTGGNIEGKSILRTAYKHWYYKDNLYKIDAIQKERHAIGVPRAKLMPGYTAQDVKTAWELVTNLRTNENSGIVQPPSVEVDFAELGAHVVNVISSIEHHEARIMLNVFAEFMLLGLQGAGGRSTAGAQVDIYQKVYRYLANMICDQFNLHLIPKLVGYNYDTDKFPKMKARNLGEGKDIQMWAAALGNLMTGTVITPDFELEQWAREQIDAPLKQGSVQTPYEPPVATPFGGDPTSNGKGTQNGKAAVPARTRTGGQGAATGSAD